MQRICIVATVWPLSNPQSSCATKSCVQAEDRNDSNSNFTKGVVQMVNFLKNLHKEESGQDLIEYALIGLLIALGAILGMSTLASSINNEFTKIGSKLT